MEDPPSAAAEAGGVEPTQAEPPGAGPSPTKAEAPAPATTKAPYRISKKRKDPAVEPPAAAETSTPSPSDAPAASAACAAPAATPLEILVPIALAPVASTSSDIGGSSSGGRDNFDGASGPKLTDGLPAQEGHHEAPRERRVPPPENTGRGSRDEAREGGWCGGPWGQPEERSWLWSEPATNGVIFLCDRTTEVECIERCLLGTKSTPKQEALVASIRPTSRLFLFNVQVFCPCSLRPDPRSTAVCSGRHLHEC